MYEDNDPVYGKGFIKMNKILTTRGWDGVIKFLQQKSKS